MSMWNKITIGQFQEIHDAQKRLKGIDLTTRLLCIVNNVTENEIDNWTIEKFNKELSTIDFLANEQPVNKHIVVFKHNGQRYKINYNMNRISYGQYCEVMQFKENYVENLHKLVASVCTPITWYGKELPKDHKQMSDSFSSLPFIVAQSVCVFFYQVLELYSIVTLPSLEKKTLEILNQKGATSEEYKQAQTAFLIATGLCLRQKKYQSFWVSNLTRSLSYQQLKH